MKPALDVAKNLTVTHNVSFNVYDEITGQLIQHHEGHNSATNSMLTGVGHYLLGDGVLNQGYEMLQHWVPKYISLGTMGLRNQDCDDRNLPTGIGPYDNSSGSQDIEISNFTYYMEHEPEYGADGYDKYENNEREYFGLGPVFADRPHNGHVKHSFKVNDSTPKTTIPLDHTIEDYGLVSISVNGVDVKGTTTFSPGGTELRLQTPLNVNQIVEYEYISPDSDLYKTIDCELISDSFPRCPISYRKIVTEDKAELPETIDIIFSAMISTGALAQFRDEQHSGNDYIFITEAGLWSRKTWPKDGYRVDDPNDYQSGDNGLLAGYRIKPPDDSNWDMTISENREKLKKEILRVGYNQVVQVVWKIQLGTQQDLTVTKYEDIVWEGMT